jgi:conjugative transfer pilus assembly protein TraH
MLRKLIAVLVSAAVFWAYAVAPAAAAGVSSNMDAYWSSGLAAASVTGPSAYTGQAGGYYTGGNISLRVPQDNYHIASVTLPSIKGGCGGIDLFTGAFSFIGADQLIAMIKNIASNAAPYAFMLALTLISSPIADQLKTFEDWAQKMNAFNISSCEAAEKIVDAGATALLGKNALCERLGRAHGAFSDGVAARTGCSSNPAAVSPATSAEAEWDPVNRNLAWDAIAKHPLLAGDHELAQLLMTVTGSIIIACPSGAGGLDECQKSVLPARGGDESVVTALLDGGTIMAHRCDEFGKCLNPVANNLAINVATNSGLKTKVLKELTDIVDNIRNRTALTPEQIDFVNMTSLPVYKMASVYASLHGASSEAVMGQHAEVIALDIAYSWLMKVTREVEEGRAHLQGIPPEDLNAWSQQTQSLRMELLARQEKVSVKMTALEDMIGRTREIEKVMQGETAGRLAEAIAYANALRR